MSGSSIAHGDQGYWEHWWRMMHDDSSLADGRLAMQMTVPAGSLFAHRRWHMEFDRQVRDYALADARAGGQIIVPPETVGSPAQALVEMGIEHGFEVRVLASEARYVVYNGAAAVLTEEDGGKDVHSLTRDPPVVSALTQFFELQWSVATDWDQCTGDSEHVVGLLARGWTDERIANELGLSERTVNRRVAELMHSTGTHSRFALGMHIGRSGIAAR
ncbi:MAG: helix-turn-helix transcriptional regulator [Leucobacter sp.]